MEEAISICFHTYILYKIFRHGERNILYAYPNDPYEDESYWPEGFGQLTLVSECYLSITVK